MKFNLPLNEKGIKEIKAVAEKRGQSTDEAVTHLIIRGLVSWGKNNG